MENCKEKILHAIRLSTGSEINTDSIAEVIYSCYREIHPRDSEEINADFKALNEILSVLPLRDIDRVWNLCCKLCSAHEKAAFLTGIRVGIQLTM